jgi:quercetin dioxygenase-like cupin family protein
MLPEALNYDQLADQTGHKVRIDDSETFELLPEMDNTMLCRLPVFTNDIKLTVIEGEPGDIINWHTHTPNLDQINVCLEGEIEFTIQQEDGSQQVLRAKPGEVIYVPAGARHTVEVVGDEYNQTLSLYRHDHVARVEILEPDWAGYDMHTWPISLWVDVMRDETVAKDDDAVSEGETYDADEVPAPSSDTGGFQRREE